MSVEREGPVVVGLIDLLPTPDWLFSKLKEKIRSAPIVEFSKDFRKVVTIPNGGYNAVICKELNYLITCYETYIYVHDLGTKEKLLQIKIDPGFGVYGIDLEHEISGQWNIILSMDNNTVAKYNFSAMLIDHNFSKSLIWEYTVKFQHVWAVRCFKTELYVIDYADRLFVLNLKTGEEIPEITVDLGTGMVDLVFTPEEEMIVCGVGHLHILKFNPAKKEWQKIKSWVKEGSEVSIHRCFGVWYEKKTKLIYVTDADGKLIIFDRDFKLVKQIEDGNSPYGILINETNGDLFVCNTNSHEITNYR